MSQLKRKIGAKARHDITRLFGKCVGRSITGRVGASGQALLQTCAGKPLVVTAAVKHDYTDSALMEIWNAYVRWRREECPKLPPEDQLFWIRMNGETVWVIEDVQAFTILYPSDY